MVESVKAASDVYAPVVGHGDRGQRRARRRARRWSTRDPEGEGWFFKLTLSDPGELDELMDEAAYEAFVAKL